jgi:hypothetical protein
VTEPGEQHSRDSGPITARSLLVPGVFAVLTLFVGIRLLRRELGFSPVGREKTD